MYDRDDGSPGRALNVRGSGEVVHGEAEYLKEDSGGSEDAPTRWGPFDDNDSVACRFKRVDTGLSRTFIWFEL